MKPLVFAGALLLVASVLIANPHLFLRLTGDLMTGVNNFNRHLTGEPPLRPADAELDTDVRCVRLAGAVLAALALLIVAVP